MRAVRHAALELAEGEGERPEDALPFARKGFQSYRDAPITIARGKRSWMEPASFTAEAPGGDEIIPLINKIARGFQARFVISQRPYVVHRIM